MRLLACSAVIAGMLLTGCGKTHQPVTTPDVVIVAAVDVPKNPDDQAWESAPEHAAKLLLQDMVEPRLLTASTAEVRIRAIRGGNEVAFRLEWVDATTNDLSEGARFCDGCAIQLPAKNDPNVTAPQMGESGRPVEIAYWNAGWQAVVDGRGDSIKDIYPNATIDHYPFEAASLSKGSDVQKKMAARYAPARALGNTMAGPRDVPVQDLIADGPGTLVPAKATTSKGCGRRTATGWAVVITRSLPAGIVDQGRSQVAFAVWEGSQQEVGSRKMRTGWIPFGVKRIK